jgi:ABC-2 type transport system ATP-binding protein
MQSFDADNVVRVERLTVAFGNLTALADVSFNVPQGSVTGLIGRNGAGKSTCIRCLAGLLHPSDRTSRVSIRGLSLPEDTRRVVATAGFLLSEPALFRYLTPAETLLYIGRAFGLSPAAARGRATELIDFFELTDAADRFVDNFSTGMQKRLSLAAALVHAPRVLVLDEPFESLDPLMVRSLKKLLRDYSAGGGTVILSSHLIDAVEEICDRVVILEKGRVVAAGSTQEVSAGIIDRLPGAKLEDLYAALLPPADARVLKWLTDRVPLDYTAG